MSFSGVSLSASRLRPSAFTLGRGTLQPLSGAFHALFDLADRGKVLIELVLIGLSQLPVQRLGVIEEQIQMTARPGKTFFFGCQSILRSSQRGAENQSGTIEGGDRLTGV